MDKWQAQDQFWNSFGLPAYDENIAFTADTMPAYPHITYEAKNGIWDQDLSLSASLWYRSNSWVEISRKADEILAEITHGKMIKVDNGYLWIKSPDGTPFAQRMGSEGDPSLRRIVLTVTAEALTE